MRITQDPESITVSYTFSNEYIRQATGLTPNQFVNYIRANDDLIEEDFLQQVGLNALDLDIPEEIEE